MGLPVDVDAPCTRCGVEPNRITDQYCSDECAEQDEPAPPQAVAPKQAPARERPRVVRLVVFQSDVERAEDDAEVEAHARPRTRGDCGPTACPGCGHRVLMRVRDFEFAGTSVVSCPECLMLLVPAADGASWEWASVFRPDVAPADGLAYADAMNHCRPCPWVGCSHHLYLDVLDRGSIRLNFPSKDPSAMQESCTLDVADRDGCTLDEVGKTINITRERVRQLIEQALRAGKKAVNPIFKGSLDVEDVNDLPDPRHALQDVE